MIDPVVHRTVHETENDHSLSNFAYVWALIAIGAAWWTHTSSWLLGIAALLIVIGMQWPAILRWPYRAWMYLGVKLSWVMTRLILFLLFVCVMTPLAVIRRAMNKKETSGTKKTYWRRRELIS